MVRGVVCKHMGVVVRETVEGEGALYKVEVEEVVLYKVVVVMAIVGVVRNVVVAGSV